MARTRIFRSLGLINLSSPSILEGDAIPHRHTALGANLSPALGWSEARKEARSLVLTFEDLRGPHGAPFTLWILFNIPPFLRDLPEGLSKVPMPPEVPGTLQGVNDTGRLGYDGPLPPVGHPPHRYLLTIQSLDLLLDLPPGIHRQGLDQALRGHVLETGTLLGTRRRDPEPRDSSPPGPSVLDERGRNPLEGRERPSSPRKEDPADPSRRDDAEDTAAGGQEVVGPGPGDIVRRQEKGEDPPEDEP